MDATKRARLEAAGFRVGTVSEFLELTPEENDIIEDRLALNDELRPEYTEADLKNRVRGKYAARLAQTVSLVTLEPDVAAAFPDAAAVNAALRSLMTKTEENAPVLTTAER